MPWYYVQCSEDSSKSCQVNRVHLQQLGNTAEVEPSSLTAYEIHQSHSMASLCCKSTCSFLLKSPFNKQAPSLSQLRRAFPSLLYFHPFADVNRSLPQIGVLCEHLLSTAFKLEFKSVTLKSCRYSLNPRCFSMCLQSTVAFVVLANCSPPGFFFLQGKCESVWRVASADVWAQVCHPDSCLFCLNSEEQIVLLTLPSETRFMASEGWSIFCNAVNASGAMAPFRTNDASEAGQPFDSLLRAHKGCLQDDPFFRTVVLGSGHRNTLVSLAPVSLWMSREDSVLWWEYNQGSLCVSQ